MTSDRAIRLSVAIAAHPARAELAQRLADKLDRDATIVWDRSNNEWDTHERAWTAHDQAATHHLVLQDDAVPCRDLLAGTEHALAALPDGVGMSLYLGDHRAYRGPDPRHHAVARAARIADSGGVSWVAIPGTWWGVAIVLPVPAINPMLEFCRGRREVYDLRVTRWCQDARVWVHYPWPSFTDHADVDSLVLPGRERGRVARAFLGSEASALDFDAAGSTLWLYPAPGSGWPPTRWAVTRQAQDAKPFPAPRAKRWT